jgi:hypothetical protein
LIIFLTSNKLPVTIYKLRFTHHPKRLNIQTIPLPKELYLSDKGLANGKRLRIIVKNGRISRIISLYIISVRNGYVKSKNKFSNHISLIPPYRLSTPNQPHTCHSSNPSTNHSLASNPCPIADFNCSHSRPYNNYPNRNKYPSDGGATYHDAFPDTGRLVGHRLEQLFAARGGL